MCKCFLDGNFFNRPLDSFVMPQIDEGADGVSSYIRKQPAFGSDKVAYASVGGMLTVSKGYREET